MKCYNCGNEGHAQRDCPEERAGGAYGGDKKCYVSPGLARTSVILSCSDYDSSCSAFDYRTVVRSVTSPENALPPVRPRPKRITLSDGASKRIGRTSEEGKRTRTGKSESTSVTPWGVV